MSKHVNVNKLKSVIALHCNKVCNKVTDVDTGYQLAYDHVIELIDLFAKYDSVEVVRCKNCKFFVPYDEVKDFDGQCVVRDCETDKEEFCSYGAKRGDEK